MTPLTAFLTLIAQAPAAGTNAAKGPQSIFDSLGPLVMPLCLVVMFYFLLIRPQQRQRKELAARVEALQPGTQVITASGVHAIVHSIKENTIILKIAEGTMVEFEKSAIASIRPKGSNDSKK